MEYRIIENIDKSFLLKPCTLGLYKRIRMLDLSYSSTSAESKTLIMQEFQIDEKEFKRIKKINVETYYTELVKLLFMDVNSIHFDVSNILLSEVNRAYKDFFAMLSGN